MKKKVERRIGSERAVEKGRKKNRGKNSRK